MIRVNFLTREYKSKLFFKKFLRFSLLLILLYVVTIFGVNMVIKGLIDKKNSNITQINNQIADTNKKIKDTNNERDSILDLSNKIKILEELKKQKEFGFSEALFQLENRIPDNIWLTSLVYNGTNLVVKGIAAANRKEQLIAGKNLILFEKRMKESKKYVSVTSNYAKASEVRGSLVQEFQYTVIINTNIVELQ